MKESPRSGRPPFIMSKVAALELGLSQASRARILTVVNLGFRFAPPQLYALTRYAGFGRVALVTWPKLLDMNARCPCAFTLAGATLQLSYSKNRKSISASCLNSRRARRIARGF